MIELPKPDDPGWLRIFDESTDWPTAADFNYPTGAERTASEILAHQHVAHARIERFRLEMEKINAQMFTRLTVRLVIPARGKKIPSRRRLRVWLKKAQFAINGELSQKT